MSLNASASVEVTKDLLNVVLTVTREGQDATTVQTQLKQALDAALAEARKVAKPGQLGGADRQLLALPALCRQGRHQRLAGHVPSW